MKRMPKVELLEARQLLTVTTLQSSIERYVRPGPNAFLQDGDTAYFSLLNADREMDVWESDGTPDGTRKVDASEFVFGVGSSLVRTSAEVAEFLSASSAIQADELIPFQDSFAFVDLTSARLWMSDGTIEGTRPVSDPMEVDLESWQSFPYSLVPVGEDIYITVFGSTELRKWTANDDGTGTITIVEDFVIGDRFTDIEVRPLNDQVWVRVVGDSDSQLWTLDSVTNELTLVRDWNDRYVSWNDVAENDDGHVFTMSTERGESYGSIPTYEFLNRELWFTDGTTEGTELLLAQNEGMIVETVTIENDVFYVTLATDGDYDLMRLAEGSDTPEKLHDFSRLVPQFEQSLASIGSTLYFVDGSDIAGEEGTLFRYHHGAADDASVEPMQTFGNGIAWSFQEWSSGIVFVADDGEGAGIWSSNGTIEGTQLLQRTSVIRQPVSIRDLIPAEDHLLLRSVEIPSSLDTFLTQNLWSRDRSGNFELIAETGVRLNLDTGNGTVESDLEDAIFSDNWVTDGTRAGTKFLSYGEPVPIPYGFSSTNGESVAIGETTFTVRETDAHGRELWATTNGELTLVRDIIPGERSSAPLGLTAVGDILYFSAHDRTTTVSIGDFETLTEENRELWRSDGTEEGTYKVIELNTTMEEVFVSSSSNPSNIRPVANGFVFSAFYRKWYASDGTEEGTIPLEVLDGSIVINGLGDESTAFFAGPEGVYTSDGSVEGTKLVVELSVSGDINELVLGDNAGLFYIATRHADGDTIWKTDGSTDGTVELITIPTETNLAPLNPQGSPQESDSRAFFTTELVANGTRTQTVWVIDGDDVQSIGTFDGVVRTNYGSDFIERHTLYYRVAESEAPYVPKESDLILRVRQADGEFRTWAYDGTETAFELEEIAEIPDNWFFDADQLYFSVEDEELGYELWLTDGTQDGTFLYEIVPGEFSSNPGRWVLWEDDVYFTTSIPVELRTSSGSRLWQIGEPSKLSADFNDDQVVNFSDFLTLSANYGKENVNPDEGDTNGDQKVDFADFLELSATYGNQEPDVAERIEPVQRNFENVEAIFATLTMREGR